MLMKRLPTREITPLDLLCTEYKIDTILFDTIDFTSAAEFFLEKNTNGLFLSLI